MRTFLSPHLLALAVLGGAVAPLAAMESFVVGPRALGMGGTGVASVNDIQAQYYNPAMFGFFAYGEAPAEDEARRRYDNQNLWDKDWGFGVDATVGLRIHNNFAAYADNLKQIYDSNLVQNIESGTYTVTAADIQKLSTFANAIQGIDNPDEFLTADINGGFGLRILHFGIGFRVYSEVMARVSQVDYANLGGNGTQSAVTQLNDALAGSTPPATTNQVITAAQAATLNTLGITPGNITTLNALAAQAGLTTSDIQPIVDLLQKTGASTGSVENNTTTVMLRGVAVAELPLSFGYAFNDHIAIGGNLKFIKGRLYGTSIRVFDEDAGETLSETKSNYQDTAAFGLDLGVCYRTHMFQAGLVGRNLTRPKFDGFDTTIRLSNGATVTDHIDDYTLDPSFAAGVAFIPFRWLTLAADLDLTRNKTFYPDYRTQNLGFGAEFNILYFLALRGGVMKNMAEDDVGLLYTAGLGLNLWLLRIDAAASMSKETTTFDGDEYPREVRGSVNVMVDF